MKLTPAITYQNSYRQ